MGVNNRMIAAATMDEFVAVAKRRAAE